MRKIGPLSATRPAGVAERSAAAKSRQIGVKRRAQFGYSVTRSAASLVTHFGDDAVFQINLKAEAGLTAGDLDTYALWRHRRRMAALLLTTRQTAIPRRGGAA